MNYGQCQEEPDTDPVYHRGKGFPVVDALLCHASMGAQAGLVLYDASIRPPFPFKQPDCEDCFHPWFHLRARYHGPVLVGHMVLYFFLHCSNKLALVVLS